jgi:hypothetical protein
MTSVVPLRAYGSARRGSEAPSALDHAGVRRLAYAVWE